MRTFRVSKRDGTYRTVVCPSREEKHKLRGYIDQLQEIANKLCPPDVVHGFWPGRSPVTNASFHCEYAYTANFDLRNFFDTVTKEIFISALAAGIDAGNRIDMCGAILEDCFVDGIARQGLPTSPVIANIAAAKMDHVFHNYMFGRTVAYTRYADDLTFSMDDPAQIEEVKQFVAATVVKHGFELNEKKTNVQAAAAGRRIITGVAVDDAIWPTRRSKRRLRAARHRGNKMEARGIQEWNMLKLPYGFSNEIKAHERTQQRFADIIDFDEGKKP